MQALIDLHFLPSLEYFCALSAAEGIVLEKHENFVKQSLRNRCYILAVGGVARLTVPLTLKHGKTLITDVQVDYSTRWQANFWRTLQSAYAKAPYFEHYADELRASLNAGDKFIYDLNLRLLSMCLQWLRWEVTLSESTSYEKIPEKNFYDLRNVISAKTDFRERGFYMPAPYHQVFGSNFVPNLSVIDLVFCEGPHAQALLRASRKNQLNK